MVLSVAEQIFRAVKVVTGIIRVAACQRALHQQSQTLELLLRLEARKDIQTRRAQLSASSRRDHAHSS